MYKLFILLSLIFFSCNENSTIEKKKIQKNKTEQSLGPQFSYKIIFTENKGWGYQIFKGATILINQEHIPAVQGLHYFSTKKNAETTAKYILKEVERGNFPPTVTKDILDSLEVLD